MVFLTHLPQKIKDNLANLIFDLDYYAFPIFLGLFPNKVIKVWLLCPPAFSCCY